MVITIYSANIQGISVSKILIEVTLGRGLPGISIIGLPSESIRQSRDRIKAAIIQSGFQFPNRKIIVNLAPAEEKKQGVMLDLPIAVAITLVALKRQISQLKNFVFVGELSLDGKIKPVKGILPLVCHFKNLGHQTVVIPKGNFQEVEWLDNVKCIGVTHLRECISLFLNNLGSFPPENLLVQNSALVKNFNNTTVHDLSSIHGHDTAKRAMEVSAAGRHHLYFEGEPGCGKTSLSECMPNILAPLNLEESIETLKVYSILGTHRSSHPRLFQRPFRNPHPSTSFAGLLGSGSAPGEISLAHNGVLFLDEFLEMNRNTLESLRIPIEQKEIRLSRVGRKVILPANFQLIVACNPCPCGFLGSDFGVCHCSKKRILDYRNKLTGALFDRIDIRVKLKRVSPGVILSNSSKLPLNSLVGKRVIKATQIQRRRNKIKILNSEGKEVIKTVFNGELNGSNLWQYCLFEKGVKRKLAEICRQYSITNRALIQIVKIARTIADIEERELISIDDVAEATYLRCIERQTIL